jgi:diguanylate cyclase (GGDEF)-like protein
MAKSILDLTPSELGFSSKDNEELGISAKPKKSFLPDDLGFSADEQAELGIKPVKIETPKPFEPSPATRTLQVELPQNLGRKTIRPPSPEIYRHKDVASGPALITNQGPGHVLGQNQSQTIDVGERIQAKPTEIKPLSKETMAAIEPQTSPYNPYLPGSGRQQTPSANQDIATAMGYVGGAAQTMGRKLQERAPAAPYSDKGEKIALSMGLTREKIKGQGTVPTFFSDPKYKDKIDRLSQEDREALYTFGQAALTEKKRATGKSLQKAGEKITGKALEIDPAWFKEERFLTKIDAISKENPGIANSFKMGDLGGATDQAVFDAAMSGNKELFDRMMNVKRQYNEASAKQLEKAKDKNFVEKLLNQTAEIVPMMAKGAAVSAIPVIGPALGQSMWARQGAGDMLFQMTEKGVPLETALPMAGGLGMVYANIEGLKVTQLLDQGASAMVKKAIKNKIGAIIAQRAINTLFGGAEEGAQQIITDDGVIQAMKAAGMTPEQQYEFSDAFKSAWGAFKSSVASFGILGIPASGYGIGKHLAGKKNIPEQPAAVGRAAESPVPAGPTGLTLSPGPGGQAAPPAPTVETQPTQAQKEAGNYKKEHIKRDGMDISIENPAGSTRSGTDKDGKAWSQTMNHDYGYIKGTTGKDKDHVDVFIKPGSQEGGPVFVVDQVDPKTGKFDEHKAMVGFGSQDEARQAYLSNYEPGWKGIGSITEMPMEAFKEWAYSSKTKKPLGNLSEAQTSAAAPAAPGETIPPVSETITPIGVSETQKRVAPEGTKPAPALSNKEEWSEARAAVQKAIAGQISEEQENKVKNLIDKGYVNLTKVKRGKTDYYRLYDAVGNDQYFKADSPVIDFIKASIPKSRLPYQEAGSIGQPLSQPEKDAVDDLVREGYKYTKQVMKKIGSGPKAQLKQVWKVYNDRGQAQYLPAEQTGVINYLKSKIGESEAPAFRMAGPAVEGRKEQVGQVGPVRRVGPERKKLSREEIAALPDEEKIAYIESLQERSAKAETEAITDPLTKLTNRRGLKEKGFDVAVDPNIALDADFFKLVNDRHGHKTGDEVLKAIAGTLQKHLGADAVVARTGGEEFNIFPLNKTLTESIINKAADAQKELAAQSFDNGKLTGITFSAGTGAGIEAADKQLYAAKQSGRGRILHEGKTYGQHPLRPGVGEKAPEPGSVRKPEPQNVVPVRPGTPEEAGGGKERATGPESRATGSVAPTGTKVVRPRSPRTPRRFDDAYRLDGSVEYTPEYYRNRFYTSFAAETYGKFRNGWKDRNGVEHKGSWPGWFFDYLVLADRPGKSGQAQKHTVTGEAIKYLQDVSDRYNEGDATLQAFLDEAGIDRPEHPDDIRSWLEESMPSGEAPYQKNEWKRYHTEYIKNAGKQQERKKEEEDRDAEGQWIKDRGDELSGLIAALRDDPQGLDEQERAELLDHGNELKKFMEKDERYYASEDEKFLIDNLAKLRERKPDERKTERPEDMREAEAAAKTLAESLGNQFDFDPGLEDVQVVVPDNEGRQLQTAFMEILGPGRGPYFIKLSPKTIKAVGAFNGVQLDGKIFINVESTDPAINVVAHESLHAMRGMNPVVYRAFINFLDRNLTKLGERAVDAKFKTLNLENRKMALEEIAGDILADNIGDRKFWKLVYGYSPKMMRDILDAIRRTYDKLLTYAYKNKLTKKQWFTDAVAVRRELAKLVSDTIAIQQGKKTKEQVFGGEAMFMKTGGDTPIARTRRIYDIESARAVAQEYGLEFSGSRPGPGGPDYLFTHKRTGTQFAAKTREAVARAVGDIADRVAPQGTVKAGEGLRFMRPADQSKTEINNEQIKQEVEKLTDDFYSGKPIRGVGIRYGDVPESGRSYNTRENKYESGVSLLSANNLPPVRSFAVMSASESSKKEYYIGDILHETGGDDEFLMSNPKKITKKQYDDFLNTEDGKKSKVVLSYWISDRTNELVGRGYTSSKNKGILWENEYQKALKKFASLRFSRPRTPVNAEQYDIFGGAKTTEQLEREEQERLNRNEMARRAEERKGGEADLRGLPMFEDQDIEGSQQTLKFMREGVGQGGQVGRVGQEKADIFFSPTLKAVQGLKQARGTGDQMFAMITKTPGVKEAEWKWMGLDDFLKGKQSVTKQEIEEFVRENQVRVEEVEKGRQKLVSEASKIAQKYGTGSGVLDNIENKKTQDFYNFKPSDLKRLREINKELKEKDVGKFSQYSLPGGENYREVLLTLPFKEGRELPPGYSIHSTIDGSRVEDRDGNVVATGFSSQNAVDRARKKLNQLPEYKSSHWEEPNVIAHVRLDDRTGPNGEKVLFVEEIQSDWAREAREKGVINEEENKRAIAGLRSVENESGLWSVLDERGLIMASDFQTEQEAMSAAKERIGSQGSTIGSKGVPAQPFLKNWEELVLKRVLRMAAEEGYDRVAWINGEQTAARYDLSKQLDALEIEKNLDGTYTVTGLVKGQETPHLFDSRAKESDLAGIIGKDHAQKVIEAKLEHGDGGMEIAHEDLKIGGEWASALYDRMIPKFLEKYGKKWGTKVEPMNFYVGGGPKEIAKLKMTGVIEVDDRYRVQLSDGSEWGSFASPEEARNSYKNEFRPEGINFQSIPITPEMRESVLYEGQPLFMKGQEKEKKPLSDIYAEAAAAPAPTMIQKIMGKEKSFRDRKDQLAADIITPLSTRLRKIHQYFKDAMRKFEFNAHMAEQRDTRAVLPLLNGIKKMSATDRTIFDLALKNGDPVKSGEIIKKYHLESEYERVRGVLDGIHQRAVDVGFDVNYVKSYWPRVVLDPPGLLKNLMEQPEWGVIEQEIAKVEADLQRPLSEMEKAKIANTYIARPDRIIEKPGAIQYRVVDVIDTKIDRFYDYSPSALVQYLHEMNQAIEIRKFLGRGKKKNTEEKTGEIKSEGDKILDIEGGIGNYVMEAINAGKLNAEQQDELIGLLRARFGYKPSGGITQKIKELGYITSMGSGWSSFITQIGDLTWAYYVAGPLRATKSTFNAFAGKSKIRKEDLGLERIAEEFRSSKGLGKALEKIFNITLLTKMDNIGKEALINGARDRYRTLAQKGNHEFVKTINRIFGEEAPDVLSDLKNNIASDNVKLLLFNRLLDFQPMTLSEMPKAYLTSPRGRLLYMLKTFTIKQLDAFRNESLTVIKKGFQDKNSKEVMRGLLNLVYLAALFIMANAGADEIKDWIFGRKPSFADKVWDNILRLFGMSRFIAWETRRSGPVMAFWKLISPPMDIVEAPLKDAWSMFKDDGKPWQIKVKNAETWKVIPFIGKHYYWWFGGGREAGQRREEKAERATKSPERLHYESKLRSYKKQYEEAIKRDDKEQADKIKAKRQEYYKNNFSKVLEKEKEFREKQTR